MSAPDAPLLPQIPLGRTGLTVSRMALGTVKFGRTEGVKYPQPFELPDDEALASLLDIAAELGVNLLDTAPAYGVSEARLGQLLTGQRDRWQLCTKVGETFEDGRSSYDFSASAVARSITRSLERLRVDRLDLVLIHSDGDDLTILESHRTLDVLLALKDDGLIRAVGMSHKTMAGGLRALELGADVLMTTYNRQDQSMAPLLDRCAHTGIGVLIKKALASGHDTASGRETAGALAEVAAQPGADCIVVGTINPAHLRANAAIIADASRR
jgi:aryl-alcohol dehydrogenase-like predicted oxidoreductase